jgi:hypothetical protein
MNPMEAFANRTARLVQEAVTPVYSTSTPAREHLSVVELEYIQGGRTWSRPMPDSEVTAYIDQFDPEVMSVSDIDHAAKCWCFA